MIRITVKGKEEMKKLLDAVPKRLGLALLKAMRDSAILIQSLAKIKAPVFRGLLRVSIVQTLKQEGGKIIGEVGSALPYASVIESGRSQGWFPNIRDLKVWARRKLGDEHLAYVVGRAIERRGFRAQPYLGPAIEEAKPRVDLIFSARLLEAISDLGGSA